MEVMELLKHMYFVAVSEQMKEDSSVQAKGERGKPLSFPMENMLLHGHLTRTCFSRAMWKGF